MNSKTLAGLISLIRPLNVAISAAAAGASVAIAGVRLGEWEKIVIAMLTGALAAAGANAINDYYDHAIDRINRPNRPIPRGLLSRGDALAVWIATSVVGIFINIFLHWTALATVAASMALLWWYSAYWKRTVLFGNIIVSAMIGMAFIYGGVVAQDVRKTVTPAILAALFTLGREIVKDIEDVEGDRAGRALTFPVRFGPKKALVLATAVLTALLVAIWVPATTGFYGKVYSVLLIPLSAVVLVALVRMWRDPSSENLRRQSSLLKGAMILGLAAVVAGSL